MPNHRNASLFILVTILFLAACAPSTQSIEGENWVIFTAEKAQKEKLGEWLFAGNPPIEYWMPSEENILVLENSLPAYLQANADRFQSSDTPVWEKLNEYNRQYFGITKDGKWLIYANYFCRRNDTSWKENFIFVLDGGQCYFQFLYDVNAEEFFDLQVNGES